MVRTSEFILNFVLNACWQVAAIFAVASFGSSLLKHGPARYRHALWVVALVACLTIPVLTALRLAPPSISNLQVVSSPPAPSMSKQPAAIQTAIETPEENPAVDHLGRRRAQAITTTTQTGLVLTLVYALFILARAIRLARFWRGKEKLRRSGINVEPSSPIQLAAQHCRRIFGIRHAIVARSREARVPYTLGARRPLILLPDAFCSGADETKLLSVIGHEMAT